MLKGHTTIELKDVVTGEVKKYEDDNMMTNYIGKLIDFSCKHALGDSTLNPYTSHWYNFLGGLCLFSQALPEDPDAFYLPAGVKPIGYGIQADTNSYTDINAWGIYNTQESDTSAAGVKRMVWDFSTSHANGTIASVALTHLNNGLLGFGISQDKDTARTMCSKMSVGTCLTQSSKGKQGRNAGNYGTVGTNLSQSNGTYVDFCIDSENDEKYMMKVCQDGLSIIKHKMYPENFSIFRQMPTLQSYEEETYEETFGSGYYYHFYNSDEQVLYFWVLGWTAYQFNDTVTINIHKFDMQTQTLTKNWKTNVTLTATVLWNGFIVTDTKLYYGCYDRVDSTYYYRIKKYTFSGGSISTLVTRTSYTSGEATWAGATSFLINGLIYVSGWRTTGSSGRNYDVIIDTSDDTARYTNVSTYTSSTTDAGNSRYFMVPPIDKTQAIWGTMLNGGETAFGGTLDLQGTGETAVQKGNMRATVHYLGTINNLSEPIIKTAQQTMKVTYTITEESNG